MPLFGGFGSISVSLFGTGTQTGLGFCWLVVRFLVGMICMAKGGNCGPGASRGVVQGGDHCMGTRWTMRGLIL